jgi:chromosome segregation ATPase
MAASIEAQGAPTLDDVIGRFEASATALAEVAMTAKEFSESVAHQQEVLSTLEDAAGQTGQAGSRLSELATAMEGLAAEVAATLAAVRALIAASDSKQAEERLNDVVKQVGEVHEGMKAIRAENSKGRAKMEERLADVAKVVEESVKRLGDLQSVQLKSMSDLEGRIQERLNRIEEAFPGRWKGRISQP